MRVKVKNLIDDNHGLIRADLYIDHDYAGMVALAPDQYDGLLRIWGDCRTCWASDSLSARMDRMDRDDMANLILDIESAMQEAS